MRNCFIALAFALFCPSLAADNSTDVFGYWAGESSILHIQRQGQQLSAVIVALTDPVYLQTEDIGEPGALRKDNNNPDPALQDRPLLGLNLLQDYVFDDGRWQGKIYDPESGNVYSSRMNVDRSGELNMRGYIGAPMFGRTAKFTPLKTCTEAVKVMLTRSQRDLEVCRS